MVCSPLLNVTVNIFYGCIYLVLSQIGEDVTRRYGYECGIRRTDFLNDEYHQLVCMEGMAICYGEQLDLIPKYM